jgi:hypothetical protein
LTALSRRLGLCKGSDRDNGMIVQMALTSPHPGEHRTLDAPPTSPAQSSITPSSRPQPWHEHAFVPILASHSTVTHKPTTRGHALKLVWAERSPLEPAICSPSPPIPHSPHVSNPLGLVARITTKLLTINPPETKLTNTILPLLAGNFPLMT